MKISDVKIKDKKPFRAYYNGSLIWRKYHERTQAIFDYALSNGYTLPTNKIAYDDLIRGLVKEGIFEKIDLLYVFSGEGDVNFRLINVLNPEVYNGEAYGGLMWSKEGVLGNGVNGYIDTNFNPSLLVEGQKYQLNDAAVFFSGDSLGFTGGRSSVVGRNAPPRRLIRHDQSVYKELNGSTNESIVYLDFRGTGYRAVKRQNAEEVQLIAKNIQSNVMQNSVSIGNGQIYLFVESTGRNYGNSLLGCLGVGAFSIEDQTFREIFNNYLTAIGLDPSA